MNCGKAESVAFLVSYHKIIYGKNRGKEAGNMSRKLIIEGNAVYEIDEECMLRKRLDRQKEEKNGLDVHALKNAAEKEEKR